MNAAPLPPHPKPEALLTAAVLYGDLEKALRKTELSDPKLKAERDKLAQGLSTIQEKLQEAATAVSAYGAAGKSATGPALSAEELAYARAKRGVESASRFLSGVITRLESVCRK